MKKTVLLIAAMLVMSAAAAVAQGFMVVDSEKVFRSIDSYNNALEEVNQMAQDYQRQIDDAFNQLETSFNDLQSRRATMTAAQRQEAEQRIINREQEITRFQEEVFGEDGTVMKRRIELIKPIQDRVFATIENYARERGFELVIDLASNPYVLYHKASANHTDAIIALVK